MKYIIAIIQPDRVDEVLRLLNEKEIHLVTVTSVLGRGRQKGIAELYRSHVEAGSLLRKV
jgi:nitrogen regulatory protein P-II 1